MNNRKTKKIEIPEICRVEGHSAVLVDIEDGQVANVQLDVFEGTRLFERIVLGHKYDEIPHITSRVCAICSTGHVLAATRAIEGIFKFEPSERIRLYRELMHLGMIIESHATHICALALPDFLGTPDLLDFASNHQTEFNIWTCLRNLGASIQTIIGGRPFHPVNLHVGGLSSYPSLDGLKNIQNALIENTENALCLCDVLSNLKLPFAKTAPCCFLALIPENPGYGFFGEEVLSSDGWKDNVINYKEYLSERTVPYSHAKHSKAHGKPIMVGAMARLSLFGERLQGLSRSIYMRSPLAAGDFNTIWNNLAQAIEIVEAIERSKNIVKELIKSIAQQDNAPLQKTSPQAGQGTGAVECPRGTLYHSYTLDDHGHIIAADMITPSAQNAARIEFDIRMVVENQIQTNELESPLLQANLETLIRAYDPCNTCATHMVKVSYK